MRVAMNTLIIGSKKGRPWDNEETYQGKEGGGCVWAANTTRNSRVDIKTCQGGERGGRGAARATRNSWGKIKTRQGVEREGEEWTAKVTRNSRVDIKETYINLLYTGTWREHGWLGGLTVCLNSTLYIIYSFNYICFYKFITDISSVINNIETNNCNMYKIRYLCINIDKA